MYNLLLCIYNNELFIIYNIFKIINFMYMIINYEPNNLESYYIHDLMHTILFLDTGHENTRRVIEKTNRQMQRTHS